MKEVLAFFFEDDAVRLVRRTSSGGIEPLMMSGDLRQRLTFMPTADEVRNDAFVIERAEAGDPEVITDFYEAIQDPERTIIRYGTPFQVVSCLDPLLGQLHQRWQELHGESSEPIPSCCLFAPGISEAARAVIREHLRANRFASVADLAWQDCLLIALQGSGKINPKTCLVVATTAFNALRFEYIEWEEGVIRTQTTALEGYGEEPRIFILAELAVRGFARKKQSQLLNDDATMKQEVARYLRQARSEIDRFEHGVLRARVQLSDGNVGMITIDERDINKQVGPKYKYLKDELKKFIGKHSNQVRTERIILAARCLDTKECRDEFAQEFGATKLVPIAPGVDDLLDRGLQSRLAKLAALSAVAAPGVGARATVVPPTAPAAPAAPSRVPAMPALPNAGRPTPPLPGLPKPVPRAPEAPAARAPVAPPLPSPPLPGRPKSGTPSGAPAIALPPLPGAPRGTGMPTPATGTPAVRPTLPPLPGGSTKASAAAPVVSVGASSAQTVMVLSPAAAKPDAPQPLKAATKVVPPPPPKAASKAVPPPPPKRSALDASSAPKVVPPPPPKRTGGPVVSAPDSYAVILKARGGHVIQVIKVIRDITGFGLKETKDLVDACPQVIVGSVTKNDAQHIKAMLEAEGAIVDLQPVPGSSS